MTNGLLYFSTFAMLFFSTVMVVFMVIVSQKISYYKKRDETYMQRFEAIEALLRTEFKSVLETIKKL